VDALPDASLSAWDAKVFPAGEFTFEYVTPEATCWFAAWVNEALQRECFSRFCGQMLRVINKETE
jgi:hypothetical protein